MHISATNTVFRRITNLCIDARTRLYTIAGTIVKFDPDGREEIVDLLRLIVILPDREMDGLRPEVSLASNDEVIKLYRACA